VSMAGLLPDSVRLRPAKAWFDSLIVDCLEGPDGAAARQLLSDPRAELGAYLEPSAVRHMLFPDGPRERPDPFQWMHQVWRLVTAECWLRAQADPGGWRLPAGLTVSSARIGLHSASPTNDAHSYVFPP
jgi:Asparagine synthase